MKLVRRLSWRIAFLTFYINSVSETQLNLYLVNG